MPTTDTVSSGIYNTSVFSERTVTFNELRQRHETMTMTDFIEVYDDALDADTCQQLIDIFENSEHRQPGRTGGGVDPLKKRSIDIPVDKFQEFREPMKRVRRVSTKYLSTYFAKHYFALIGSTGISLNDPRSGQVVPVTEHNFKSLGLPNLPSLIRSLFRLGSINAQKYEQSTGGYPHWHSEVFPELGNNEALHRILLFMFYLNDIQDGGETEFYYQQRSVSPRAGRMVVAPAYFTHTHRGNTPISDHKYILTSWVLYNPANVIYGPHS